METQKWISFCFAQNPINRTILAIETIVPIIVSFVTELLIEPFLELKLDTAAFIGCVLITY